MSDPNRARQVIPSRSVRRAEQPVLVDCSASSDGHSGTMTVIPLTENGEIHAFEVRCQCGSSIIVECLYEENES